MADFEKIFRREGEYIVFGGKSEGGSGIIQPEELSEFEVFARTLYGEARGESWGGIEAVACVVMNRANNPGWWGRTVKTVCLKPSQFSCWNKSDPNYELLTRNTILNADMERCRQIATLALGDELYDFTQQSTHYCVNHVTPIWAKDKDPVIRVGNHKFFNDID